VIHGFLTFRVNLNHQCQVTQNGFIHVCTGFFCFCNVLLLLLLIFCACLCVISFYVSVGFVVVGSLFAGVNIGGRARRPRSSKLHDTFLFAATHC